MGSNPIGALEILPFLIRSQGFKYCSSKLICCMTGMTVKQLNWTKHFREDGMLKRLFFIPHNRKAVGKIDG